MQIDTTREDTGGEGTGVRTVGDGNDHPRHDTTAGMTTTAETTVRRGTEETDDRTTTARTTTAVPAGHVTTATDGTTAIRKTIGDGNATGGRKDSTRSVQSIVAERSDTRSARIATGSHQPSQDMDAGHPDGP